MSEVEVTLNNLKAGLIPSSVELSPLVGKTYWTTSWDLGIHRSGSPRAVKYTPLSVNSTTTNNQCIHTGAVFRNRGNLASIAEHQLFETKSEAMLRVIEVTYRHFQDDLIGDLKLLTNTLDNGYMNAATYQGIAEAIQLTLIRLENWADGQREMINSKGE